MAKAERERLIDERMRSDARRFWAQP